MKEIRKYGDHCNKYMRHLRLWKQKENVNESRNLLMREIEKHMEFGTVYFSITHILVCTFRNKKNSKKRITGCSNVFTITFTITNFKHLIIQQVSRGTPRYHLKWVVSIASGHYTIGVYSVPAGCETKTKKDFKG